MTESLGPGSHPRHAVGLGQVSFPLWSYLPPVSLWKVERNDGTQQLSQDWDILDSGWTGVPSHQSQEFMDGARGA